MSTATSFGSAAAASTSGGHHATQVVDFCKARWRRRIYATKGQAGTRPIWPKRASRTRNHEAIYVIGVDTAKDTIYNRLRIGKPGPGYIHFPARRRVR